MSLGEDFYLGVIWSAGQWRYASDNTPLVIDITNWKKGKETGSDEKSCVKFKNKGQWLILSLLYSLENYAEFQNDHRKGEWENHVCDHDHAIVCDVGIDCVAVSSNKIIVGGHSCTTDQECVNTIGSYECKACDEGFEVVNGECKDINECDNGVAGPQAELNIERLCQKSKEKKSFWDAVDFCKSQGGMLFEPRNSKDAQFLSTIDDDLFVGLDKQSGSWRYVSDNSLFYIDAEGRSSPPDGLRKNSDSKTCMKWSKKGEQKEDKCFNHDHYFVCAHQEIDCYKHSGDDTVKIKSEPQEACSVDQVCVNTEGSFSCREATTTATSTTTTSTTTTATTTTSSTTMTKTTTSTTTSTTISTTTTTTTTTSTSTKTSTTSSTTLAPTTTSVTTTSTVSTTESINNEIQCLNEAWVADQNGQCSPKDDFFAIRCSPDGIEVSVDRKLVPDARSFAFGTCPQTLDFDNDGRMIFKTTLDDCSTSLSMKNDKLVFSNTIRKDFETLNHRIFFMIRE